MDKKSALATKGDQFSLDDIRAILADGIRDLRAGTSSPANVNALSNATGKILSSVKLEMEYFKAIGKRPQIDMIVGRREAEEAVPRNGVAEIGVKEAARSS